MGLALTQRAMATVLLVSCLAGNGVSSAPYKLRGNKKRNAGEMCPPCELLFSKLEKGGEHGKLTQDVMVQERGEPKSGTGFMYFWATATLIRTCGYLDELFGEGSCVVGFNPGEENDEGLRSYNRSMTFEPALASNGSRCSCDTVDRVTVTISNVHKHKLPVTPSCAFSHRGGMDLLRVEEDAGKTACKFADGSKVENKDDLWRCMHEASCDITDDWLQMVVFRDPRPAVVSSYFHRKVHGTKDVGELERFVARELPILCQWLAIRYILFCGLIPHQSIPFWYDDAIADPLVWHYQWFGSVGLQLPPQVVQDTAKAAAADNLGFNHKDIDEHPGDEDRTERGVRRFEDEVSPEVVEIADAVLRVGLPSVILEKLGVAP